MKNKYLLTVKYALMSMTLGLFGLVGISAINEAPASAASDTLLSISVNQVLFNLSVDSPVANATVGDSFSLDVSGNNIDTVDVYIDLNGDGIYDSSELLGTFTIGTDVSFGPGYSIGPVSFPIGTPSGLYNMKVVGEQYNGGDDTISQIIPINYSFSAPQIDKITPDFGTTDGGDSITIEGQNFETGSKVYIGGNECQNTVVVSPTKITCVTPPGAEGRVAVTVTGPNGTYTDSYGFLYVNYGSGGGGGGAGVLPKVPNTGLFRVGDSVVMSADVIIASLLVVIIILIIILIKKNQELYNRKSTKTSAKKPANRARSKKYSNEQALQSKTFRLK